MRNILICLFLLFPYVAIAGTECDFEIDRIFLNLDGNHNVYATIKERNIQIYKNKSILEEAQLDRFYSLLLTAKATGSKVKVRFFSDNLDCSSISGSFGNISGIWLLDS